MPKEREGSGRGPSFEKPLQPETVEKESRTAALLAEIEKKLKASRKIGAGSVVEIKTGPLAENDIKLVQDFLAKFSSQGGKEYPYNVYYEEDQGIGSDQFVIEAGGEKIVGGLEVDQGQGNDPTEPEQRIGIRRPYGTGNLESTPKPREDTPKKVPEKKSSWREEELAAEINAIMGPEPPPQKKGKPQEEEDFPLHVEAPGPPDFPQKEQAEQEAGPPYVKSQGRGSVPEGGQIPGTEVKRVMPEEEKEAVPPYFRDTSDQTRVEGGQIPGTEVQRVMPEEVPSEAETSVKVEVKEGEGEVPSAPPEPETGVVEPEEPKEPEPPKKKKKVVFADISDVVEKEAIDVAETKLEKERTELKGFRGFIKRIWKHNWVDSYYRHKERVKALAQMEETKDIYVAQGEDQEAMQKTRAAVIERFVSEYEKEMLSKGESKEVYADLSDAVREAINEYAQKTEDDEVGLRRRFDGIIVDLAQKRKMPVSELAESVRYINNFFEVARETRHAYQTVEDEIRKQSALLEDIEVIWGQAKSGVKTEAQYSKLDRIITRLEKSKAGSLLNSSVNEFTVAGSASLAYCIGRRASETVARSTWAKIITFGGAAGVSGAIAGVKEHQRLARERKKHFRDLAKGKEFSEAEAPRRREMQEYVYETVKAQRLIDDLGALYKDYNQTGERKLQDDLTPEQLQTALDSLAELEARIKLNEEHNIDLITFSSGRGVEQENYQMRFLRGQAREDLKALMDKRRRDFAIPADADFDQYLEKISTLKADYLLRDSERAIEEQDRRFKKMQRIKTLKRGAKAAAIGLGVGTAVQEGIAFLSEEQQGLLESVLKGKGSSAGQRATGLLALRNLFESKIFGKSELLALRPRDILDGAGNKIGRVRLPEGYQLIDRDADGNFELWRGNEVLADDINFNPATGEMSGGEALKELGIDFENNPVDVIRSAAPAEGEAQAAADWYDQHEIPEGAGYAKHTDLSRDWANNDSPEFDFNEHKMLPGGENYTGIDQKGNYVFNILRMKKGIKGVEGSWKTVNGQSVEFDAPELIKDGQMKVFLSASQETQNQVFEIPVQPNGDIIIPHNSELARVMFEEVEGQAVFKGGFAETVVSDHLAKGDPRGVARDWVLATVEGRDTPEVPPVLIPGKSPDLIVNIPGKSPDWDLPPVIPILGRYPLESERREAPTPEPISPISPEVTETELAAMRADLSPRLKENPAAELNPQEEIDWYFRDQERRHPGYNGELGGLAQQETAPMAEDVEGVVCLAVAGDQDPDQISRTLETYAVQKNDQGKSIWDGEKSKYEILLYVHSPQGEDVSETLKRIEEFKEKHAEIPIHVYQQKLRPGKLEPGWVEKKALDLGLKRKLARGDEGDILLVMNDADLRYSAEKYLDDARQTMQSAEGQKYDAIRGRYDFDPEAYRENPTFHASMRFWQFMEALVRAKDRLVTRQGRNTIMRGSVYAGIGGNRTYDFGADAELSKIIQVARGDQRRVGYANRNWVMADASGEIEGFEAGEKIAFTWGDWPGREDIRGGPKSDYEIPKDLDLAKLAEAKENSLRVVNFRKRLEAEMQGIIDFYGPLIIAANQVPGLAPEASIHQSAGSIKRGCVFLGVKAEIEPTPEKMFNLKIKDTSRLRKGLLDYRDEHYKAKLHRKAKAYKHPLFAE